jgi:RNA polymerase sigma factor (sigma-70 family)
MPTGQLSGILHYLRRTVAPRDIPGVADAELLERFRAGRDEAAFEVLVWRHSKTVLGICRRVLRDEHEAEDAFQAAFLALARHAGGIRRQQSVGGWLYRVSYRIALDARERAARRAARQEPLAEAAAPQRGPAAEAAGRELLRAIEAEVNRLPEKYRLPLVRSSAGESSAAIARDLGCPPGTVESWLTRARQRLRVALVRRGVLAPAGILAAVLAARRCPACVPTGLVATTVRMAVTDAAGNGAVPADVAVLAAAVPGRIGMNRWKVAAALVLMAGMLGAGTVLLTPGTPGEQRAVADPAPPPASAEPVPAKPVGPGRIFAHVLLAPTLFEVLSPPPVRYARVLAIDPDTGKWEQVNEKGGFVRVSPDGRAVVFIRATQDQAQIWSCDSRGQEEPKRLADKGGQPVWSADGKGLVTTHGEVTPQDSWKTVTWRLNADGSGATRLPIPDTDFVNDVSPDGRWFVTSSDRHPPRGRGYQLYLMHPDGTGQRRLTQGAGLNCTARFSPDGRQLLYLHQERGVNSLHVMDCDGGKDRVVIQEKDRLRPEGGCWSPDGKRLAVVLVKQPRPGATDLLGRPIQDSYRLEIMDADGGNRRELKLRTADDVPLFPVMIGDPDWHVRPSDR